MRIYDRGRARRSLFDTVAFRALSQLATLASYVVLVRAMPKQDFGLLNLLYAFIPVVSALASLGLEQALKRYQPEYLHAGRLDVAAWLVRWISSARLLSNLVIIAVLLLSWGHVAPIFGLGPYRDDFMLFSVLLLIFFQVQLLQLSVAAHMLHRFSVGSIALLSVVKLLAYGGLAAFDKLTLETAILVDTAGYSLVWLFLREVYRRLCLPPPGQSLQAPPADERRRILRYGLLNNFNDAGTLFLDSRTDNFFIAAFIDAISVGVYAFYTRLTEMASNLLPTRMFETVVQPMFFSIPPADSGRRLPEYFSFLLNVNLALQWPVMAFALAEHAEIVQVVFGGRFLSYSWLLPLVVAFSSVNSISTPVTLVAQYEERAGVLLLSKVFAVANFLGMLLLIPTAGLYGAAIASGLSQFLKNLFVWWKVRKRAVWLNAASALLYGIGLWGSVVAIAVTSKVFWHATSVVHLFLGLFLCAIAGLLHLRGRAIRCEDRALLGTLFSGRESRLLRWVGLAPVA